MWGFGMCAPLRHRPPPGYPDFAEHIRKEMSKVQTVTFDLEHSDQYDLGMALGPLSLMGNVVITFTGPHGYTATDRLVSISTAWQRKKDALAAFHEHQQASAKHTERHVALQQVIDERVELNRKEKADDTDIIST